MSDLYKIFKNNPNGCSVKCIRTTTSTNYQLANYTSGYFVALTDNCTDKNNKTSIINDIHQQAKRLKLEHYFIGYWKDIKTNKEYIDLAIHIEHKPLALTIGSNFKQKAIFDCANLESIYLI